MSPRHFFSTFCVVFCGCLSLLSSAVANPAAAAEPLLRAGDRLALVGGTFVEQMRSDASLEFELQTRRPDWRLTQRNVGWAGDNTFGFARKVFDTNPEQGFQRMQADLKLAEPTVILFAYGFAEASNGAQAVQQMEAGLTRLVETAQADGRRVILMQPFALPGVLSPGYTQQIEAAREVIGGVAKKHQLPVVSPRCDHFTNDGMLPSSTGFQQIADDLADALVGRRQRALRPSKVTEQLLREAILKKEELFFHRHRPQNETYLLLFRKHEQGNNAVELPQFDPLVDQADQEIWQLAERLSGAASS